MDVPIKNLVWIIIVSALGSIPALARENFHFSVTDSASITTRSIVAQGRFINQNVPCIASYVDGHIAILPILDGNVRVHFQFISPGTPCIGSIIFNSDSDPEDEFLLLIQSKESAHLALYGHGAKNVRFFTLFTPEPNELWEGWLDLIAAFIPNEPTPTVIGAVRTNYSPHGSRLLFGLDLGNEPELKWVKNITQSFESVVSLPMNDRFMAVFGGHATLNELYYNDSLFIDDHSDLTAVSANGEIIAVDEYGIRNPRSPDKAGYMHTWVKLPPAPDPTDPIVVALRGSVEYQDTLDGLIGCYRLDYEGRRWETFDTARFDIDENLITLDPDENGNWRFFSKFSGERRLALLTYSPAEHRWVMTKTSDKALGNPHRFLWNLTSSDGEKWFVFRSFYGAYSYLEAFSYNNDDKHVLIKQFEKEGTGIFPLLMNENEVPSFFYGFNKPYRIAENGRTVWTMDVVYYASIVESDLSNGGGILLWAAVISIGTVIVFILARRRRQRGEKRKTGDPSTHAIYSIPGMIQEYAGGVHKTLNKLEIIFGNSLAFNKLRTDVERLYSSGPLRRPVLIWGETGVGKSYLAEYLIHKAAFPNGNHPFIELNVASLQDTIEGSEIFGVRKGAYTGAVDRPGKIEDAENGTLFLDEVQDSSPTLQKKLLGVLQNGRFWRLGESGAARKAKVQWIMGMSENPSQLLREGKLIQPFHDRITVHVFRIPPLRERPEDILPLCDYFWRKYIQTLPEEYRAGYKPRFRASYEVYERLLSDPHEANVRGIENFIERIVHDASACKTVLTLPVFELHWKLDVEAQSASPSAFDAIMNAPIKANEPAKTTLANAGICTWGDFLKSYSESGFNGSNMRRTVALQSGSVGRNTFDRLFNELEQTLGQVSRKLDRGRTIEYLKEYLNKPDLSKILKNKPFKLI